MCVCVSAYRRVYVFTGMFGDLTFSVLVLDGLHYGSQPQ